jgi:hypothetical protein
MATVNFLTASVSERTSRPWVRSRSLP